MLPQVRQFHRVPQDMGKEISPDRNKFKTLTSSTNFSLPQLTPEHSFADLISRGWQPPPTIHRPSAALLPTAVSTAWLHDMAVPRPRQPGSSRDYTSKKMALGAAARKEHGAPVWPQIIWELGSLVQQGVIWAGHTGQAVPSSDLKPYEPKIPVRVNSVHLSQEGTLAVVNIGSSILT